MERDGDARTERVQLALMTGRSNPADARPSASQAALLGAVAIPGVRVLGTNFPWPAPTADGEELAPLYTSHAQPVPLWRASLQNAAQYASSRRPTWKARHRPAVERRVALVDRTVLLCGSCGLELLANLSLPRTTLMRLHVFAWGPVARRLPPVATLELVQGRTDWLSRTWIARTRVDHIVDVGHMDYLLEPDVIERARRFVTKVRDDVAAANGGAA